MCMESQRLNKATKELVLWLYNKTTGGKTLFWAVFIFSYQISSKSLLSLISHNEIDIVQEHNYMKSNM